MTTRRDKTPNLHRFNSPQIDQPFSKSPNIYTKQLEKQKTLKESTPRGSLARSKYKKVLQKNSNQNYSDQNDRITLLLQQNSELRKEIVELKVHQFYQFDDKKLKQLLIEVQTLKKQIKKCKEQLQEAEHQNDFLKRSNAELKAEVEKFEEEKLYEKRYREKTIKNLALSPRAIREDRQDEEMTQRIIQKPVVSLSNPYEDLEECRRLMQSKSTTKKDRVKRIKQTQNEVNSVGQSLQVHETILSKDFQLLQGNQTSYCITNPEELTISAKIKGEGFINYVQVKNGNTFQGFGIESFRLISNNHLKRLTQTYGIVVKFEPSKTKNSEVSV